MLAKRSNSQGARKRGLKPAKRSRETSVLLVRESSERSGYALGLKFFVFSLVVFFFFFWFLMSSRLALFVILPSLVLGFGSALLLYALFSLAGWAKPLLEIVTR